MLSRAIRSVQITRMAGLGPTITRSLAIAAKATAPVAAPAVPEAGPLPKVTIVQHPHALNPGDHSAGPSATNNMFAVICLSGSQYKVTQDDVIVADKLFNVDIGMTIEIDQVLMVAGRNTTLVGRPEVPGARVRLEVEELTKDKKVIAFKMRRRKSSRRTKGHRRQITVLRVKEIIPGDHVAEFVP